MAYRIPKKSKREDFVVYYGEDTFHLPKMDNLPMAYLVRIQAAQVKATSKKKSVQQEGQIEMMEVFMDVLVKFAAPVAEDITTEQFTALMDAWAETLDDEEREDLGES